MGKKTIKSRTSKKAREQVVFNVTEKHAQFMTCNTDEVLFGGATGGVKSYAQLIDALQDAIQYPGIKQLILRETFPELSRSLIQTSAEIYPQEYATYNSGEHK